MIEKSTRFMTGKDRLLAGVAEGNADDGKEYLAFLIGELSECRPLTKWASQYLAESLQKILDGSERDPFTLKSTARKAKGYLHSETERAAFACVSHFMSAKGGGLTLEDAIEPARQKLIEDYGYKLTENTVEKYYKNVQQNPPDYTKAHPYK